MSGLKRKPTSGGGDFVPAPEGNHPARVVAVIDLGTQERAYKGNVSWVHQLYVAFELVGEEHPENEGNFVVCERYTLSYNERANLRKLAEIQLQRRMGEEEEHDPEHLLGAPLMVEVVHRQGDEDRVFANVKGVSSPPRKAPVAAAKHKLVFWEMGGKPFENPGWLPRLYGQTVEDLIAASAEKSGRTPVRGKAAQPARPREEQIPF